MHLARPGTWPELRHLAELGVELVDPGNGGANWATTAWEHAVGLVPDLVLADARANAVPAGELDSVPAWEALTATATVEPWNPELPCSAARVRRFSALGGGRAGGAGGQEVSSCATSDP